MSNNDLFAQRLKNRRRELRLSQSELGRKAGIAPAQISRYESGVNIPRDDIAAKIANALEVTFDWLMNGTGALSDGSYPKDDRPAYQMSQIIMGTLNIPIKLHIPQELMERIKKYATENGMDIETIILAKLNRAFDPSFVFVDAQDYAKMMKLFINDMEKRISELERNETKK